MEKAYWILLNKNVFAYHSRNDYDGIKYILSSDNFNAWHEEYENFKKQYYILKY